MLVPCPVSRQWLPPRGASLPSFRVPVSPVPPLSAVLRRRYDFPSAHQRSLIGSLSAAHAIPPAFVFAAALLEARRTSSRPGRLFVPAAPTAGLNDVDANGISQVFRRSILCLCSVPGPRSSRRVLTRCGHLDAAPAIRTAKASAMADFGADSRSFGTRCSYASRVALPHTCKARFRLAGSPLPGGRRTLWTATKGFSSFDDRPPFLLS